MLSEYLTAEQQNHWHEEGYVILKQVLSPPEVDSLLKAVESAIETYVQETPHLQSTTSKFGKGAYTIIRAIEQTDALDPLTDHPNTFGAILALMGALSANHGDANLCPPPAR